MGRTIISTAQGGPGAPYDRASPDACTRHDLQARTLSSRRTTPKFDERRWRKGTASGEDFGTNQGEGNHARVRRPSRQLYNGTEEDSRGQSLRGSHSGAVTPGQSLHGGHFTPVASLSRPLPVCPCYKCSPLTLFDTAPATAAVWSPPLATSPQCECYGSLLYPSLPPPPLVIRPADHALPVLKFRSKSKLQVRAEDGIYHLVPSVQAGTRDHR